MLISNYLNTVIPRLTRFLIPGKKLRLHEIHTLIRDSNHSLRLEIPLIWSFGPKLAAAGCQRVYIKFLATTPGMSIAQAGITFITASVYHVTKPSWNRVDRSFNISLILQRFTYQEIQQSSNVDSLTFSAFVPELTSRSRQTA